MKLNGYVPGDPGSGRSVARPVSSIALLSLRPHDANTDHDRSLPTTGFVAAMALARCVARWITEGRLRFGVVHSGCCAGTLYMVVINSVNRLIPAGASTPGWRRSRMPVAASAARSGGRSRSAGSNPGCRLERPRYWPLYDRNMVLAGGIEPTVSGLRNRRCCHWTTRASGWEQRIRTAIAGLTVRGPTVGRTPNAGGPGPTRTAIPDSSGRCPAGWTTGPWFPRQESNLDVGGQSPRSCHWTTRNRWLRVEESSLRHPASETGVLPLN